MTAETGPETRVHRIRLTSHALDFWVDVSLCEARNRWLAVASIGGEPEIGCGVDAVEAIRLALKSLGSWAVDHLVGAAGEHDIRI